MRIKLFCAVMVLGVLAGCSCDPTVVNPNDDGGAVGGGSGGGGGNDDGGLGGGTGGDTGGGTGGDTGGGSGGGSGGGGGGGTGGSGGCGLRTCATENADCGLIGDGCGNLIDCGTCTAPKTCGGGGVPSKCGGVAGCLPRTCADVGANCGPVSDGCNGLLNCGSCATPATCGGGGISSRCGELGTNVNDAGICIPTTCAAQNAECGVIGDGCGGILTCSSCTGGKSCGAGGVPYRCGGGTTCIPRTCPPGACGAMGDGCTGILNCTTQCVAPQICGGGGVANQCGGGSVCVPRTLAQVDAGCGMVGDGCGGLLDAGMGNCAGITACGAGGVPNQCGGAAGCVAKTCASLGVNCGFVGDGCGGILNCTAGTGCPAGQTCGGGGTANVCGAPPPCVPKTPLQLGKNCGPVGDGCGALVDAGTCTMPDICGGSGNPSVCGNTIPDGGSVCTNLCLKQTTCNPASVTTTLTGRVLAPTDSTLGYGTPDPIPNALVYVPNDVVQPFPTTGVSCDKCTAGVTGKPLVTTYSDITGAFSLTNVPCGVDVPVVIQLGKWRRQVTMPAVACCATTAMPADKTRMPRRQAEGHANDNIPLIALVTGSADTIENVLPKIGIEYPSQYTLPSGTGRVRYYQDNGWDFGDPNIPAATQLFDSLAEMKLYDMIIIDCVGGEVQKTAAQRKNLEDYTAAGGRVFSSHFGYVWLYDQPIANSFTPTATWNPQQNTPPNQDAFIDTSFTKGQNFATWVQNVGAAAATSTALVPRIPIRTVRHDFDAVIAPAQRWVYGSSGTITCTSLKCTDIAVGASGDMCSRSIQTGCGSTMNCGATNVCTNGNTCGGGGTPGQCGKGSACVPRTCANLVAGGMTCGVFSDGCGGQLNCGTCAAGQYCGVTKAGQCGTLTLSPFQYTFNTPTTVPSDQQCGRVLFSDFHVASAGIANGANPAPLTPQEKVFEYLIFDLSSCIQPDVPPPQTCTKRTCAQQGFTCGLAADGCGGSLDCGPCTLAGQTCGGGGTPNVCGTPCTPKTCAQMGFNCGSQGDGCGGKILPDPPGCGVCTVVGQTCGGGGTPGVCGGTVCTAKSCQQLGFTCGLQSNGCGGTQDCGNCTAPLICGGGGVPGQCGGGATCTKVTCSQLGFNCGQQTDGCGGTQNCGVCTVAGQVCGGGGNPGICGGGGTCTPKTCAQQGFTCGLQGDGCGGQLSCGNCATNELCGAASPGLCGTVVCTPLTCGAQNIGCGPAGDGCGNLIFCGSCPTGQTCGGGGTPGACGAPVCTKRTCAQIGAECGAIGDGCGGSLDCGPCTLPKTCGGGGVPNVCGGFG